LRIVLINIILVLNLLALTLPEYFSADFTQKIYSDNNTLTYKGKIFVANNKVYWKYIYPNEKEIWINDKVYVYEPDLMQVTISKKPKLNIFNAIKNAKKIKDNIYLAKIDNKKIYFIYNKTLQKVWYKDDVGNEVKINFYKQSAKKFDITLLKPKFPEDVDFIYQN
jgi:outer membrane lipoprotein carrier protein